MARGVRRRIKAVRFKPTVNWTAGTPVAAQVTKQYPLYVLEANLSTGFAQHLTVGTAFVSTQPTIPAEEPLTIRDFPLLRISYYTEVGSFKIGSLFMYAGTLRCKERKQDGTTIVVQRRTFVGPTGRFIVVYPESVMLPLDDAGKFFGAAL